MKPEEADKQAEVSPQSACLTCIHLKPIGCDAFPDGIPEEIFWEGAPHDESVSGDHGITYERDPNPIWPPPGYLENAGRRRLSG